MYASTNLRIWLDINSYLSSNLMLVKHYTKFVSYFEHGKNKANHYHSDGQWPHELHKISPHQPISFKVMIDRISLCVIESDPEKVSCLIELTLINSWNDILQLHSVIRHVENTGANHVNYKLLSVDQGPERALRPTADVSYYKS